jgi:hypothetical protein
MCSYHYCCSKVAKMMFRSKYSWLTFTRLNLVYMQDSMQIILLTCDLCATLYNEIYLHNAVPHHGTLSFTLYFSLNYSFLNLLALRI